MGKTRGGIVLGCCFFGAALLALAQERKAGLWEVTSNMTLQQSPFPAGMTPPAGSPLAPGEHTTQICITQEQIDKFGAISPNTRSGCEVTNINKSASGMTADMVCTGRMSGKGTIEASLTDSEHTSSKVHFTGSVQSPMGSKPVEWTSDSTSTFKSADCGSVKPMEMPGK